MRPHTLAAALAALAVLAATTTAAFAAARSPPPAPAPPIIQPAAPPLPFSIASNQFLLGDTPTRLLVGELHYFRIPRAYWADRLARAASLGLTALQVYVPWNFHERAPGRVTWSGRADLAAFLDLAASAGFRILLRPGPYICAEWDGGGLPWWLRSPSVAGGAPASGGWRPDGRLRPRSADPLFLAHVRAWFSNHLLPLVEPYMAAAGGPILAVQVENEYGFCGDRPGDEPGAYLRALVAILREGLGSGTVLYTTDPPSVIASGTLAGEAVTSFVDFGPGADVAGSFATAAAWNPPGRSPAYASEWYTGWLTHAGESMARTDTAIMARGLAAVLAYEAPPGNGTAAPRAGPPPPRPAGASLSLYMAVGGTNWGFWGGANIAGRAYLPHITSYDYDCPVGEGGTEGQVGVPKEEGEGGGSPSKADVVRAALRAVHAADGTAPLAPLVPLPPPPVRAYGTVALTASAPLLSPAALALLSPGRGVRAAAPAAMETVGQAHGLILYRVAAPAALFVCGSAAADTPGGPVLDTGGPVHDYATVLLTPGGDGGKAAPVVVAGRLDRSSPVNLTLPCLAGVTPASPPITLDLLVEAVGRDNFGCGELDWKGLEGRGVRLGGKERRRERWGLTAGHSRSPSLSHARTHTQGRTTSVRRLTTHTRAFWASSGRHTHISFPFLSIAFVPFLPIPPSPPFPLFIISQRSL